MDNQIIEKSQIWTINGRRYFGHTKADIPTEVTVKGQSVHIKIKFKTKTDFEFQMVNGKKELVPTEKDIETEVYSFKKTDVRNIDLSKKFLWYTIDYVMLVIAVIAAFFTKGLFLLAGAFYLFFFVRCRHLVITLNSGQEIKIPVSLLLTRQEDLEAVKTAMTSAAAPQQRGGTGMPGRAASFSPSPAEGNGGSQSEPSIPLQPEENNNGRQQAQGHRFCVSCGQKMQVEWACCPACGTKAPVFDETFYDDLIKQKKEASSTEPKSAPMPALEPAKAGKQNESSAPQESSKLYEQDGDYEVIGRTGRLAGYFTKLVTKITIKGKEISVNTRKERAGVLVNWEHFTMDEIAAIDLKERFSWNILELCIFPVLLAGLMAIMGFLLFDELFSISRTLAVTAAIVIIWEVYMLFMFRTNKLVIFLSNGSRVKVPIDVKEDIVPFLDRIGYSHDLQGTSRTPFYQNIWQSKKRRQALMGVIGAVLLSFASVYGLHLLDGLSTIQGWDVRNGSDGEWVEIKDFVEHYCGNEGHWSARRKTIEKDGFFEKGDVCIEVTYSISDKEVGESEIRFLLGDCKGEGITFDVSYLKLFGIKCEGSEEIYNTFFHMLDMYLME